MNTPEMQLQKGLWPRVRRWLVRMLQGSATTIEPSNSETYTRPDLESIRAGDVEEVERAKVIVERKLHADFERNLREPVRVVELRLEEVDFFAGMGWQIHPSMNVLLGKNGYGKSLLLRTLAGMLQRDESVTGTVFRDAGPEARIELAVTRNGMVEKLVRDRDVFLAESAGKVPLLAIPDSRFTDRRSTTVTPPDALSLATDGALHFLQQWPYQAAVEGLLYGLCVDYYEHGGEFDLSSFRLLNTVVRRLTGQPFEFRRIERVRRTGFKIWVRTEGLERDLEIQHASQGTLSVIAIFGLIHSFLLEIAQERNLEAEDACHGEAIVLVDEVDAHLHPAWQQKIRNLLTDTFPNVQFIVSAHSPLVVAGCGPGEVSVLRKPEGRFGVEQLSRDFVGASAEELYGEIFDIEDLDEVFLRYVNRGASGDAERMDAKIDELSAKEQAGSLSDGDELEFKRVLRDRARLDTAAQVEAKRWHEKQRLFESEAEVQRLQAELARYKEQAST